MSKHKKTTIHYVYAGIEEQDEDSGGCQLKKEVNLAVFETLEEAEAYLGSVQQFKEKK